MILLFSKELYPRTALIKTAYNFTDRMYIYLDIDENNYIVELENKPGFNVSEKEFRNEMICQTARYTVYLKTKNIRELLTARAMASTIIDKPNCTPPEKYDSLEDENAILTDWFDLYDNN